MIKSAEERKKEREQEALKSKKRAEEAKKRGEDRGTKGIQLYLKKRVEDGELLKKQLKLKRELDNNKKNDQQTPDPNLLTDNKPTEKVMKSSIQPENGARKSEVAAAAPETTTPLTPNTRSFLEVIGNAERALEFDLEVSQEIKARNATRIGNKELAPDTALNTANDDTGIAEGEDRVGEDKKRKLALKSAQRRSRGPKELYSLNDFSSDNEDELSDDEGEDHHTEYADRGSNGRSLADKWERVVSGVGVTARSESLQNELSEVGKSSQVEREVRRLSVKLKENAAKEISSGETLVRNPNPNIQHSKQGTGSIGSIASSKIEQESPRKSDDVGGDGEERKNGQGSRVGGESDSKSLARRFFPYMTKGVEEQNTPDALIGIEDLIEPDTNIDLILMNIDDHKIHQGLEKTPDSTPSAPITPNYTPSAPITPNYTPSAPIAAASSEEDALFPYSFVYEEEEEEEEYFASLKENNEVLRKEILELRDQLQEATKYFQAERGQKEIELKNALEDLQEARARLEKISSEKGFNEAMLRDEEEKNQALEFELKKIRAEREKLEENIAQLMSNRVVEVDVEDEFDEDSLGDHVKAGNDGADLEGMRAELEIMRDQLEIRGDELEEKIEQFKKDNNQLLKDRQEFNDKKREQAQESAKILEQATEASRKADEDLGRLRNAREELNARLSKSIEELEEEKRLGEARDSQIMALKSELDKLREEQQRRSESNADFSSLFERSEGDEDFSEIGSEDGDHSREDVNADLQSRIAGLEEALKVSEGRGAELLRELGSQKEDFERERVHFEGFKNQSRAEIEAARKKSAAEAARMAEELSGLREEKSKLEQDRYGALRSLKEEVEKSRAIQGRVAALEQSKKELLGEVEKRGRIKEEKDSEIEVLRVQIEGLKKDRDELTRERDQARNSFEDVISGYISSENELEKQIRDLGISLREVEERARKNEDVLIGRAIEIDKAHEETKRELDEERKKGGVATPVPSRAFTTPPPPSTPKPLKLTMAFIGFDANQKYEEVGSRKVDSQTLTTLKPNLLNVKHEYGNKFNLSCVGDPSSQGEEGIDGLIKRILKKSCEEADIDPEDASIAILISVKHGRFSAEAPNNFRGTREDWLKPIKDDLRRVYGARDPISNEKIDKAFDKMANFSARFGELCESEKLYTGNEDRINLATQGQDLKILTPLRLKRLPVNFSRDLFPTDSFSAWQGICDEIGLTPKTFAEEVKTFPPVETRKRQEGKFAASKLSSGLGSSSEIAGSGTSL